MLVNLDIAGVVATLTLNRPERRNALGTQMMQELALRLGAALADGRVGAIVLTGTAPAFCAGSDLKELAGLSIAEMCAHEAVTAAVVGQLAEASKPVIAAVEGYALGGGMALAAACDIVVTSTSARWHMPEVGNGWLPPWGLAGLVNRLGVVRARLLTWGPEPTDGIEAHRLGLADYLAEPNAVLARAASIAAGLARLPRDASASTKQFFVALTTAQAATLDGMAAAAFAANCRSAEAAATFARFGTPP
jgi:enoyl-CoA hydratase/carnithine racemase